MPYKITWEPRGVVQKVYGHVTIDELESANNEMFGDFKYDDAKYGIFDASEVTSTDLTTTDSTEVAHTDSVVSSYSRPIKLALVATHPVMCDLILNYIETHTTLNTPWEMKKFESVEDARNWINP